MNHIQAEKFLTELFSEVWTHGNHDKVASFYTKDIVAYFGSQKVGYSDIKNRAELIRKKQLRFDCEFYDVLASDDKIAFRVQQKVFNKNDCLEGEFNHIIVYHMKDGKISKIYACNSCDFDYLDLS